MKLYTHPLSPNCRKVHAVAAHAGVTLDEQVVDLMSGAQKQPEFLQKNPNGKVPVLEDGELSLWESNAISCYLAGKADSDLWPKSQQRYDILRWCFWEARHLNPAVSTLIGQHIFNAENPNQEIIEKGLTDFRTVAGVLNNHLEGRDFLSGDTLTVADFVVGVWFGYTDICKMPTAEFPQITRWLEGLRKIPAYAKTDVPSGN